MIRRPSSGLLLLAILLLLGGMGCGGDSKEFRVTGNVTFDGKPVPKGFITFEPDASKGNTGPGGGAEIRSGSFATTRGKGISGGAYVVKIVGYDGVATTQSGEELPDGRPLFPTYTTKVDFPKESTTKDFAVPLKPPPTPRPPVTVEP